MQLHYCYLLFPSRYLFNKKTEEKNYVAWCRNNVYSEYYYND